MIGNRSGTREKKCRHLTMYILQRKKHFATKIADESCSLELNKL